MMRQIGAGLCLSLGFCGILLGCERTTPSPVPAVDSPFQTDARLYSRSSPFDETLEVYAQLQNDSSATIVLEPLVDTRVLRGKSGLLLMATLDSEYFGRPPMPYTYTQPLVLDPSQAISVDVSASYLAYDCYTLELYYQRMDDTSRTYVIYSNFFAVEDAMSGVKPECPSGAIEVAQPVDALSSQFELFSTGISRWIIPYCYEYSAREDIDIDDDDAKFTFSTLERLTEWGTWEVLYPERDDCLGARVDPIRVSEPRVWDVWGAPGFDWAALPAGWYRWHLRYYDLFELKNGRPQVWAARSWFTDMFYIGE